MSNIYNSIYNPDVLSCLANLSNDEVFTPPEVANAMLDMLPQDLFESTTTKFLDPAVKSGVFLREIAKRLIKAQIPDYEQRNAELEEKKANGQELSEDDKTYEATLQAVIDNIMQNQIYGIAITELTSLLARRSVYCSKYPNSIFSISKFNDVQGNIRFKNTQHVFKDKKCIFCGASQEEYGDKKRKKGMEQHAYEWIHTTKPKEIFNMKFDVIIGNPPYQLNDAGNGVSAVPIFQHFVDQAKKLNPRYLSMIIPARWYAGGKGLGDFRESMLNDSRIRKLIDFESSKDCFDGVNIAGGICYFLWDRDNKGTCELTNMLGDNKVVMERELNEYPILIRSNTAISIVKKVLDVDFSPWSDYAYPRNPFGFATNFRGKTMKKPGDIEIITSVGIQYISRDSVTKNTDIIDSYKVLIGRLVPSNGELDINPKDGYKVITDTRIIGPGQINTETYLDIGVFKTLEEARNFDNYLRSKFARFLLKQAISSLNVTRECFRFVPAQDFTKPILPEELYKKYNLTSEEIDMIETTMRSMDLGGE